MKVCWVYLFSPKDVIEKRRIKEAYLKKIFLKIYHVIQKAKCCEYLQVP